MIAALVEGNSIRATARMTGVAKDTVIKLLARVGKTCAEYQDKALRNLPCKRIQCDEIWSFCYAKEKNLPEELRGKFGYGDVWTWTALCAETTGRIFRGDLLSKAPLLRISVEVPWFVLKAASCST